MINVAFLARSPAVDRLQPAMPPPIHPGLPDEVLAILREKHEAHVRLMRANTAYAVAHPGHGRIYRVFVAENTAAAFRIRRAMRDSGHGDLADALTAEAWGIAPKPDEGAAS